MTTKVQRLGVRALNDYSRRSYLTYLSLRYAMEATAVCKDRWAREVCPAIVAREPEGGYHVEYVFKEIVNGKSIFRTIYSPGSNEALSEAALLEACGKAGGIFSPQPEVFSYRLAKASEQKGSFSPYFDHFRRRQRAIGRCCKRNRKSVVLYADIRNFYPSLSRTKVKNFWKAACHEAGLDETWIKLGLDLLERQRPLSPKGLMVGPMLSHLMADLALRAFDSEMRRKFKGRYFRYVDDIAVVVPASGVGRVKQQMARLLQPVGVKLHPKKFAEMPCPEWAKSAPWQGASDSIEQRDRKWIALVDRIKCYLLKKPDQADLLGDELRTAGIRIPLPRYQADVTDPDYLARLKKRMETAWFRNHISKLTIPKIILQARRAVTGYMEEFSAHWANYGDVTGKMAKKWHVSRIKGLLGKLTMLAPEQAVPSIAQVLEGHPEFVSSRAIFRAIERNDVTELISFGGSICGAAGQVLATRKQTYRCTPKRWPSHARQGFSTLCLMGVKVDAELPKHVKRDFDVRFVMGDYRPSAWRRMKSRFERDLMAISKEVSLGRNQHLINSPFNPDDEWLLLSDELNSPVFSPH